MSTEPKRRWLSITLREMLLLTCAVGLGLGWYREYNFARPLHDLYDLPNTFDPGARWTAKWTTQRTWNLNGFRYEVIGGSEPFWAEYDAAAQARAQSAPVITAPGFAGAAAAPQKKSWWSWFSF